MADNPEEKEGGAVPPKVDLRKSGIVPGGATSPDADEKKPLFTLKPASEPGTTAKRETSRIPLDAARPPAAGVEPKTIRIKPAAVPGAIKVGAEGAEAGASKRTTSRISLESVLGSDAAKLGGGEAGPKTIRLKRPGETARAADEEAGMAPTIRRTVRVKRAAEGAKATVARAAVEEAPEEFAGPVDVVNPVFPIFAILSILVVGVLIYVLMAQAFGPDSSMTGLSYGLPDMDLSWPGKMLAPGR